MGINNLLPSVKPVVKHGHISLFSGKRIAIDGYVWLHRSAFACAKQLLEDPSTPLILNYCKKNIEMLKSNGLQPYFVFDGRPLPGKAETNKERKEIREEAKKSIESGESDDQMTYAKTVTITHATVKVLIDYLKEIGIPYIVAPFEADAQLAYLCRNNYADIVLTEDTDLICYKSPVTLFKLDSKGNVDYVIYQELIDFLGLSSDQFTQFCILITDVYGKHIRMMGFKTALDLMKKLGDAHQVIDFARSKPKFTVPEEYEQTFDQSYLIFNHQIVYDPNTESTVHLTPTTNNNPIMGSTMDREMLKKLVTGEIDPFTL